jgi:hypothetical protein
MPFRTVTLNLEQDRKRWALGRTWAAPEPSTEELAPEGFEAGFFEFTAFCP